ncbi:MAG: ribulose-phosphate 3-epimerase [Deltaproteobacteria bacterium]|nr:ribulose-phosphate 3-epimerase [Deltaproteobacteria bacterium]
MIGRVSRTLGVTGLAATPKPPPVEIVPAILVKDRRALGLRLEAVAGVAKRVQIDIMDGRFVPNRTVAPEVLAGLDTPLKLEAHLMVKNPLAAMTAVGNNAAAFLVHIETCGRGTKIDGRPSVAELAQKARDLGASFGLALNPETPLEAVKPHLALCDELVIMTVKPGFGGQPFKTELLGKIREARRLAPTLSIAVDGGIHEDTAAQAVSAGANLLVAGSALFRDADIPAAARRLLQAATAT